MKQSIKTDFLEFQENSLGEAPRIALNNDREIIGAEKTRFNNLKTNYKSSFASNNSAHLIPMEVSILPQRRSYKSLKEREQKMNDMEAGACDNCHKIWI